MSNPGAEEETPYKKKLKFSSPSPCRLLLSSLPDEIVLSCLARTSRLDYASLSLTYKWLRSILVSPNLYNVRSLIGCTENCIYLCLRIPPNLTPTWFWFSPKTPLNRPRRLVPIRSHLYQPQEGSSVVAHGYGIYIIGGRINGRHTSSVFFLDCRSHSWTTLPSMSVASPAAGVVDGKIYVLGGCVDFNLNRCNWGEVFDIKTQTWGNLGMPPSNKYNLVLNFPLIYESAVMVEKEEKIFALNGTGRGLFYVPSEGIWKPGNSDYYRDRRGWCLIDNVMYCCVTSGEVMWCEAEELEWHEHEVIRWSEVMGLGDLWKTLRASKLVHYESDHLESCKRKKMKQGLLTVTFDDLLPGYKLSSSGSNMLLFLDVLGREKLEIWCAEISLERRREIGQIWGNIEWSEAIITLDPLPPHHLHCKILSSLSLNL